MLQDYNKVDVRYNNYKSLQNKKIKNLLDLAIKTFGDLQIWLEWIEKNWSKSLG